MSVDMVTNAFSIDNFNLVVEYDFNASTSWKERCDDSGISYIGLRLHIPAVSADPWSAAAGSSLIKPSKPGPAQTMNERPLIIQQQLMEQIELVHILERY
jgi:hypothetical protein